mmetsp:Transcript_112760/g.324058  ORF Transcript_112760/g.324058 Transcript_112760/m.324058 type:complete len:466 (+) Transcript_112760:26-1423(+)
MATFESFREPQPALRAFDQVSAMVGEHGMMGLPKAELRRLLLQSECDEHEREIALQILDQVDVDENDRITQREWFDFVDKIAEDIMEQGHMSRRVHWVLGMLDMFQVETWHKFKKYKQVSWVGAILGLVMRVSFAAAVISSIMIFFADSKTTMLQEFVMNNYLEEDVSPFFFYFRTAWWEQMNDPTVFSFEMSCYVKRVDEATGEVIEDYHPVEQNLISDGDIDWWPDSVGSGVTAVAPLHPAKFAGAYHLNFFKQLEVRLVPCSNDTAPAGVVCKPQEVIRDTLHGGSVNFVARSNEMGFATARTQYWTIMMDQTKQIDLWFDRKVYKVTGKYAFFDEDQVRQHMVFTSSMQQIGPQWSDGTAAVWWFSQSPNAQRETLVRETITEFMAECGGTWATLISIFGLAAFWYNRRRLSASIGSLRVRARFVEDLRILCSRPANSALGAQPPAIADETEAGASAVETV